MSAERYPRELLVGDDGGTDEVGEATVAFASCFAFEKRLLLGGEPDVDLFGADAFACGRGRRLTRLDHGGQRDGEDLARGAYALLGGFAVAHGFGIFEGMSVPFIVLIAEDEIIGGGDAPGLAEDGRGET